MAYLPLLRKSCCCCSPIVGAAFISLIVLFLSLVRIAVLFMKLGKTEDYHLEDTGIFYILIYAAKFFSDEGNEVVKPILFMEIGINIFIIVLCLGLLIGVAIKSKLAAALFLYWLAVCNFLRGTAFLIRVIPLYYNYTSSDFYAMGMGPITLAIHIYIWFAIYTFYESIPEKAKK